MQKPRTSILFFRDVAAPLFVLWGLVAARGGNILSIFSRRREPVECVAGLRSSQRARTGGAFLTGLLRRVVGTGGVESKLGNPSTLDELRKQGVEVGTVKGFVKVWHKVIARDEQTVRGTQSLSNPLGGAFLAATCLLMSSCAVTMPLGESAKYGRLVVGYEAPPSLHAWADGPEKLMNTGRASDGKAVAK